MNYLGEYCCSPAWSFKKDNFSYFQCNAHSNPRFLKKINLSKYVLCSVCGNPRSLSSIVWVLYTQIKQIWTFGMTLFWSELIITAFLIWRMHPSTHEKASRLKSMKGYLSEWLALRQIDKDERQTQRGQSVQGCSLAAVWIVGRVGFSCELQ